MAIECVETQEWIEEEISKPVDEWVEKTEKRCKKRPWWHPLRWLCWLVDRIMYSSRQNSWIDWWTLPKLLLTKGEPSFTLDEGMQTWDYIIEHFPARCLGGNAERPASEIGNFPAERNSASAPKM